MDKVGVDPLKAIIRDAPNILRTTELEFLCYVAGNFAFFGAAPSAH